jgi:hypothetical protein
MKCIECGCCTKGFFKCEPEAYACLGVKEPFVIKDVNVECTEYPEMREEKTIGKVNVYRIHGKDYVPYVDDDGIYMPNAYSNNVYYQCVMTKELFVEAYNKWIKGEPDVCDNPFIGRDDADDWSED